MDTFYPGFTLAGLSDPSVGFSAATWLWKGVFHHVGLNMAGYPKNDGLNRGNDGKAIGICDTLLSEKLTVFCN